MSSLTTPSQLWGRQRPSTTRRLSLLPNGQLFSTTSLSAIIVLVLFLLLPVAHCDYISNNQQQISRKLSSLSSYKDVQLFRFQIPAEVSTAVLRLNASQSEVVLNTTIALLPASSVTNTSNSNETVLSPPATPPPPTYWPTKPPPTVKPPLINTTLITVYREKAVKFYRSFLSTACKTPLDVTFHLRWGALPIFAIKNASTPANFIVSNETASDQQFRIQLKTDSVGVVFNLSNPLPGDWYGAAYINQVNDHIAQKGLQRECFYRLLAGLSLQRLPPTKAVQQLFTGSCCNSASSASASTPLKQSLVIDHTDTRPELLYKFYPAAREFGAKIVIRGCHFRPSNNLRHHPSPPGQSSPYASSAAAAEQALISQNSGSGFALNNAANAANNNNAHNTSCPITINFRTLALPSATQKDFTFTCQSNHSSGAVEVTGSRCVIDLPTYAPEQWNYLQISPLLTTEQTSPYEPVRTKLVYGTVNFTLQLLVGQEALLYSHFNEQCTSGAGTSSMNNAQSQQQQQQYHLHQQQQQLHPSPASSAPSGPFFGSSSILSSTHNPVLSYPGSFNHVHSGQGFLQTTAASVVVPAPPEPNAVSSQRKQSEESKPPRSGGSGAGVAPPEVDEFEMNPHSSVLSTSNSGSGNSFRSISNATTVFPRTTSSFSYSVPSTSTRSPPSTSSQHNNHHHSSTHDDTIEYVDDGEDETAVDDEVERALSKSSLSQFAKRSADPQGGSGGGGGGGRDRDRERKKSDKKKEGKKGRGQKGQKGQGKKNKDQQQQQRGMNFEDESCVFDPAKILSSLEEDELSNMTQPIVSTINITRYQGPEMFEFLYSHLEPAAFFAVVNKNNNNEEEIANSSSSSSNSVGSINDGSVVSSDNSGYGYGYSTHSATTTSSANTNSEIINTDHLFVEVDNDRPSLLNFTVIPQYDIGGSLEISFAISPKTSNEHQNVSAILCLTHHRLPPIVSSSPLLRFDEACTGHLVSNTSVANYSTEGSPIRRLTVPYPQPGTWFISIVVRCYTEEDSLDDPMVANVDYSGYSCDFANRTAVYLEIHSASCQSNRCQNGGKCMQYVSGGILYSTCACRAGWKGLTCADGSEALSEKRLLLNFLLLTVSNAAFIPAIIVAAARRYFTESAVYFITMVSSALYHACESDYVQYSYCVLSTSLLQFADFYTAVLSFFVTLITLANLSPRFKSFLHLMGAIAIALITQNDRTSLWTFVVPAGLATLLLFTCWCSQCCRRSCYPPGKCWIFSVCPALLLTIAGLVIYAFFETQENYAITHSIWHGIVALALLFAIPSMPSKSSTGAEGEEDDERVHFMSSSSSSGAGSGKGTSGQHHKDGTGNSGAGKGGAHQHSHHSHSHHPETYYELIGEEASHLARSHPQGVPANAKHITKTY